MNYGKRICEALKEVRKKVAEKNEIPLVQRECTYEGGCDGTCPQCEAEVRYLEAELQRRYAEGKSVVWYRGVSSVNLDDDYTSIVQGGVGRSSNDMTEDNDGRRMQFLFETPGNQENKDLINKIQFHTI